MAAKSDLSLSQRMVAMASEFTIHFGINISIG